MDIVAVTSKKLAIYMKNGQQFTGQVCEFAPPGYQTPAFRASQEDSGVLWVQDGPRTLQIDTGEIAAVAQW